MTYINLGTREGDLREEHGKRRGLVVPVKHIILAPKCELRPEGLCLAIKRYGRECGDSGFSNGCISKGGGVSEGEKECSNGEIVAVCCGGVCLCDFGHGGLVGALAARGIESEVVKLGSMGKECLGI